MALVNIEMEFDGNATSWEDIKYDVTVGKINALKICGVDFARVVRCKDCMYYEQGEDGYEFERGEDSWGVCENTGAGMMRNGFCSDGERKDNEHTD